MEGKTQKFTEEERLQMSLERELADVEQKIRIGAIPKNPTRTFEVGEEVRWGNHKHTIVLEKLFDGLAYLVHCDYMGSSYGKPQPFKTTTIQDWNNLYPMKAFSSKEVLHEVDDVQIRFYNADMSSLLHVVYHGGVDFNPTYQRDFVWTQEQKISLLDSIFSNVDIGKFTFIKHGYERDLYLEILDGKQRLSTLLEFYEDRLQWRGRKFTELSISDKHHFESFPIIRGECSELTEQQIYRLFVKMNTSGTPVDKFHLDKIKRLILQ